MYYQFHNTILPYNSLQLVLVILSLMDRRIQPRNYLLGLLDLHLDNTYLLCMVYIKQQNLTSWYQSMFRQDMESASRLTQDSSDLQDMVRNCHSRHLTQGSVLLNSVCNSIPFSNHQLEHLVPLCRNTYQLNTACTERYFLHSIHYYMSPLGILQVQCFPKHNIVPTGNH